jgi:hypothetical protein
MNRPTRAVASLLLAVCVAISALAPAATAAEAKITYEHESEAAFAKQLAAKQIQSATINKRLRTVRLTLTDGRHVLARYPKHHAPQTAAQLKAHGVSVTVLSKKVAEKEAKAKKPTHHKIRYIVGGVVIVVIVIVGAVLLVNRRRQRD